MLSFDEFAEQYKWLHVVKGTYEGRSSGVTIEAKLHQYDYITISGQRYGNVNIINHINDHLKTGEEVELLMIGRAKSRFVLALKIDGRYETFNEGDLGTKTEIVTSILAQVGSVFLVLAIGTLILTFWLGSFVGVLATIASVFLIRYTYIAFNAIFKWADRARKEYGPVIL